MTRALERAGTPASSAKRANRSTAARTSSMIDVARWRFSYEPVVVLELKLSSLVRQPSHPRATSCVRLVVDRELLDALELHRFACRGARRRRGVAGPASAPGRAS